MNKKIIITAGILFGAIFVLINSAYTVHETNQAIVLRFGEPQTVKKDAGIHFKVPFLENIHYVDNRILSLDPPEFEVLLTDKKRINVDAYARYKIIDPLLFYQRIKFEENLRQILGKSLNAGLRRVIGKISLPDLLSNKRKELMVLIKQEILEQSNSFGVEIVDVRIGRTNLPETTANAVYSRMKTEREREAREARAEGEEIAQKIRSAADRDKIIILAEGEKKSQILRGEGDAKSNEVLSKQYGRDVKFFEFYKSMMSYEKAFNKDKDAKDTTIIMSPESKFLKYFRTNK